MPSEPITVRIRQYAFQISAPYAIGTKLAEVEVQVLNDLRADNIRNNMTKPVLDAIAGLPAGALLPPEAIAELQAVVTKYDQGYSLRLKHTPRPREGALDVAVRQVAEEWLETQCRAQAIDPSPEEREAAIQSFMALPEIQAEARKRLTVRQQIAKHSLEDL